MTATNEGAAAPASARDEQRGDLAQEVEAKMLEIKALKAEIQDLLKGRMVRVISDHNGQAFGNSRKSWRGQERRVNFAVVDAAWGVSLQLESHESECFIYLNEVEVLDTRSERQGDGGGTAG